MGNPTDKREKQMADYLREAREELEKADSELPVEPREKMPTNPDIQIHPGP